MHLFADDVKLYLRILNAIDIDQLQGALNDLVQWADLWQLSLSIDKCCVLSIGKHKFDAIFSVGGVALGVILASLCLVIYRPFFISMISLQRLTGVQI